MMKLPPDERAAMPPKEEMKPGRTVLELGNKKNAHGLYRNWYEERGLNYLCLDWNGEDGAIALDMRYSITPADVHPDFVNGFKMVTNFGFSEHVDDQLACWTNIHNLVAFDGWLCICMPLMPHWKGHGLWMPTYGWYLEFARLNGYWIRFQKVWDRERPTFVASMKKLGDCKVFEMPVGMIEQSGTRDPTSKEKQ